MNSNLRVFEELRGPFTSSHPTSPAAPRDTNSLKKKVTVTFAKYSRSETKGAR